MAASYQALRAQATHTDLKGGFYKHQCGKWWILRMVTYYKYQDHFYWSSIPELPSHVVTL